MEFSIFRGGEGNVLELPKNHFKAVKKLQIFHMLGGGGQPTYGKFHMFFEDNFLKASLN